MDKQSRLEKDLTYFTHLKANWKVAWLCFILCIFHFVHGILPFSWTEHERYISGDDF